MKQAPIFLSWILIFTTPLTLSSTPDDQKINLTINNHMNGSTSTAAASNQISTKQTSSFEQASYDFIQSMKSAWADLQKNTPGYIDSIIQHKYKICACTLGAGYLYLQYQLHNVHNLLQDSTSWCNWKETVSMQSLVCAPHNELVPQLLTDIQKKYLLSSKTTLKTCKISPFDQFINDVSYELTLLQQYITIQKVAKCCYLSILFPFLYQKSMIQEKINRLHIMLDVFVTWQTRELLK